MMHIDTHVLIKYGDLNSSETVNFTFSLDDETKVLANITGGGECTDHAFWTQVGLWCRFDVASSNVEATEWNHTDYSVTIHIEAISNDTSNFEWAFGALCLDQSFTFTRQPTP